MGASERSEQPHKVGEHKIPAVNLLAQALLLLSDSFVDSDPSFADSDSYNTIRSLCDRVVTRGKSK